MLIDSFTRRKRALGSIALVGASNQRVVNQRKTIFLSPSKQHLSSVEANDECLELENETLSRTGDSKLYR